LRGGGELIGGDGTNVGLVVDLPSVVWDEVVLGVAGVAAEKALGEGDLDGNLEHA
jgi:hypothetical protein